MAAEPKQIPARLNRCTPLPRAVPAASDGWITPAGPDHRSAAVFTPPLSTHLISDIVTTVAVCLIARKKNKRWSVLEINDVVTERWSGPVSSNQRTLLLLLLPPSPEIGVTVKPLPCAQIGRSSPLLAADAAAAAPDQTMDALSAQARIINTDRPGDGAATLCFNSSTWDWPGFFYVWGVSSAGSDRRHFRITCDRCGEAGRHLKVNWATFLCTSVWKKKVWKDVRIAFITYFPNWSSFLLSQGLIQKSHSSQRDGQMRPHKNKKINFVIGRLSIKKYPNKNFYFSFVISIPFFCLLPDLNVHIMKQIGWEDYLILLSVNRLCQSW